MSGDEAERYLLSLELFGMRFGLERMRRLMADPAEIDRILAAGADAARVIAAPVLAETKRLVGFWPGR